MKNILILALLLSGFVGLAQKELSIVNFSTKTITVTEIYTKAETAEFPWFGSAQLENIVLEPGEEYHLKNTHATRFPFVSTAGYLPAISQWRRATSITTITSLPSNTAYLFGSDQVFRNLIFTVDNITAGSGSIGDGTYGSSNPITNVPNSWQAYYDTVGTEYIIAFFDL